ncbi:MAG: type VI secretion system Vgr family protein [Gammaproteobacteria bacterium]
MGPALKRGKYEDILCMIPRVLTHHPGTLSGIHSHSLDGTGYNQWVIDDTQHQLRMRLASSTAASQLNLGHLIHQSPASAQRGSFRGEGFELR